MACDWVLVLLIILIFTTFAPKFREEGALKLPLFCYKMGNAVDFIVISRIKVIKE